jgi:pyruvate formate lyase activating enzyme
LGDTDSLFIFQKGFNYSQDGPGNRLVYHLAGCNLKCPWCSNPEGLTINKNAKKMSVDEIVSEALSSKMIFIDGGGVTLTGGEVTCQKDGVINLFKRLKSEGINTCIETNASIPHCEELFELTDYMIADFKSPCPEDVKNILGGDIDIIKNNLKYRVKTGKPLIVRIPLIKYFNCGEEKAEKFSIFFKELSDFSDNNLFFEILTYHEFGKEKYAKEGLEYTVTNGFVTDSDVKILLTQLNNKNLKVINT